MSIPSITYLFYAQNFHLRRLIMQKQYINAQNFLLWGYLNCNTPSPILNVMERGMP